MKAARAHVGMAPVALSFKGLTAGAGALGRRRVAHLHLMFILWSLCDFTELLFGLVMKTRERPLSTYERKEEEKERCSGSYRLVEMESTLSS